jgi:hypothetical protein
MFNQRPTLDAAIKFMTLPNERMTLHLEIDKATFWKLTKLAADDQLHVEDWLEKYLETFAEQLN